VADDLQVLGVALDDASLYFDARPSARYPTVEVRVADTCTDVRDTVLLAEPTDVIGASSTTWVSR